eukprot:640224-Pelagomonas_calceolata.AAC.2
MVRKLPLRDPGRGLTNTCSTSEFSNLPSNSMVPAHADAVPAAVHYRLNDPEQVRNAGKSINTLPPSFVVFIID